MLSDHSSLPFSFLHSHWGQLSHHGNKHKSCMSQWLKYLSLSSQTIWCHKVKEESPDYVIITQAFSRSAEF